MLVYNLHNKHFQQLSIPLPFNSLQNSPWDKLKYMNKLALLVLEWITDSQYNNRACITSWNISCSRYHCGQDMFRGWGLGVQPSPTRNYMNDINCLKHSGNKCTICFNIHWFWSILWVFVQFSEQRVNISLSWMNEADFWNKSLPLPRHIQFIVHNRTSHFCSIPLLATQR